MRALIDAPDSFAATTDVERARPDEEWKARATPEPSSMTFLAIQQDEVQGMVGVQRDEQGGNWPLSLACGSIQGTEAAAASAEH